MTTTTKVNTCFRCLITVGSKSFIRFRHTKVEPKDKTDMILIDLKLEDRGIELLTEQTGFGGITTILIRQQLAKKNKTISGASGRPSFNSFPNTLTLIYPG